MTRKGHKQTEEHKRKRGIYGSKYDRENAPLCACGCGQKTKFSYQIKGFRKYLFGHQPKQGSNNPNFKYDKSNPPLCKCGCGKPTNFNYVLKGFCKYLPFHHLNGKTNPFYGKKHTKISRSKISKNTIKAMKTKDVRQKFLKGMEKRDLSGEKNPMYGKGYKLRYEKNGRWLGGKSFEPYGLDFNEKLKEQIRKRDGYICQECERHQKHLKRLLNVHHIDYDKEHNDQENLISLCDECHAKTNFDRKHWKKHFYLKRFFQRMMNSVLIFNKDQNLIGVEEVKNE